MRKWRDISVPEASIAMLEAPSGPRLIRTFFPSGLHLAIEGPSSRTVFYLDPADALELARAIEREYGGRNE